MILFSTLTTCGSSSPKSDFIPVKQLTFSSKNHSLDNNDNFSFDDKWIVYDTRGENGIGGNGTIEKVDIESGIEKIVYQTENQTKYGPGVGAASYNHHENKIIFIHGLNNCNKKPQAYGTKYCVKDTEKYHVARIVPWNIPWKRTSKTLF